MAAKKKALTPKAKSPRKKSSGSAVSATKVHDLISRATALRHLEQLSTDTKIGKRLNQLQKALEIMEEVMRKKSKR
jgi:exopolyphosphatase/pppGpp-phosphohydrolase